MLAPSRNHAAVLIGAIGMLLAGCGGGNPRTVAVATQPAPASRPATMPSYLAPRGSFVTKYPAAWQPRACESAMLELVPRGSGTEARIVTVDVPWVPPHWPIELSITRIDKGFVDDLKKRMSDVVIDEDVNQVMAEAKARRIHATAVEGGVPMVVDAVVALHHENVYILSAETDKAGAADASAALESVLANWQWK